MKDEFRCQYCGQTVIRRGAYLGWMMRAAEEHFAANPGWDAAAERCRTPNEMRAIRDFSLGHASPEPYMVDGGGPASWD